MLKSVFLVGLSMAQFHEKDVKLPCWNYYVPNMATPTNGNTYFSCNLLLNKYINYEKFNIQIIKNNIDDELSIDFSSVLDDEITVTLNSINIDNSTKSKTYTYFITNDMEKLRAISKCNSDNGACQYDIDASIEYKIKPWAIITISIISLLIIFFIIYSLFKCMKCCCKCCKCCCCKNKKNDEESSVDEENPFDDIKIKEIKQENNNNN